jgi:hypothetical protein
MGKNKKRQQVFTAELFWSQNDPHSRMTHIKGLHPLAYGASFSELTDLEKRKVRAFIDSCKE